MKNHKYWNREKEFDTKTLIENNNGLSDKNKDNFQSDVKEAGKIGKEKSEQVSDNLTENDTKITKNISDSKELSAFREYLSGSNETKVYEPRPLTPDDDIYEDVLEQFASAPTKPKYWFEEFGDYWSCSCGHINKGSRCKNCGLERDLLRSLFILHKPADEPGKLNKKLKKAKEQVDKEEKRQEKIERQRKHLEAVRGDSLAVVPIIEESDTSGKDEESKNDNDTENSVNQSFSAASPAAEADKASPENKAEAKNEAKENSGAEEKERALESDTVPPENPGTKNENAETASSMQNDTEQKPDNQNHVHSAAANNSEAGNKEKNSPKPPKRISFRAKIIIAIVILLLLASAGGFAIYKYLAAPAMQYNEAIKLQNAGKYEKAIAKFEALGNYKDSKELIWECYISIGDQQYENGQFQEAIETYNIAMELKESDSIQEKIRKCHIGIGDQYYESGDFEKALASYNTAMEMERTDSLQEKINKTKFGYVKAYQSKRTEQVEQYMADLMVVKYPGIQKIHDDYYAWHVKIIANTSENDLTTDAKTISRKDTAYFHATLSGGEPSEEIELYYEVIWPNNSSQIYNLGNKWKAGSNITARFQYPIPLLGSEGNLVFKLYDKSTNELLGSDTVTFKN